LAQTDDDGRVFPMEMVADGRGNREERLYKLFARRGMWFLQPLFGGFFRIAPLAQTDDDGRFFALRRWRNQMMMGGSCEWIGCHPQNIKTMRQFNLLVLGILGTFVNSFRIRMLL